VTDNSVSNWADWDSWLYCPARLLVNVEGRSGMLDKYSCPQPPDHSIVQLRVVTHGQQVAPIRGLESTASHIYFLCCAGLLFEALECFLLRSWLSRFLRHPAKRAEWAYSYLLLGPTRGPKVPGSTLGEGRQTSHQTADASAPKLPLFGV